MEEILASIRRIIADEKEEPSVVATLADEIEAKEEVLELTQVVEDDGSVVNAKAEDTEIEMAPIEEAPTVDPFADLAPSPVDTLISDKVAEAATSSLAALASTIHVERRAAGTSFLGNGARTLEDMVLELMKPLLKEWLDQNLPTLVERVVQKEVERIARKVQD